MDYLERKAIVTAVEIQREINNNTKDILFFKKHIERLAEKNRELDMQLYTLKEDYKECKL